MKCCWLFLHHHIPYKNVRCLIWRYLNDVDRLMIILAHNQCPIPWDDHLVEQCVQHNYIDFVKQGITQVKKVSTLGETAALCDRLDLLKWLDQRDPMKHTDNCFHVAVQSNASNVVSWLMAEKGCIFGYFALIEALRNGHVDMVRRYGLSKWRQYECPYGITNAIFQSDAYKTFVQMARDNHLQLNDDAALCCVLKRRDAETLQQLNIGHISHDHWVCAMEHNMLVELLQCTPRNTIIPTIVQMRIIQEHTLDTFVRMHQNVCHKDSVMAQIMCKCGALDKLQYSVQHGHFTLNTSLAIVAARSKQYTILRYLYDQGVEWSGFQLHLQLPRKKLKSV